MLKSSIHTGLLMVLLLIIFGPGGAVAKVKRGELTRLPQYEVHRSSQLPRDVQVSTFLTKGETKVFFYWSNSSDIPFSVTVTPCVSALRWWLKFRTKNDTTPDDSEDIALGEYESRELRTVKPIVKRGQYLIVLEALERDCYTHVYVSTEPDGPQALKLSQFPNLRLQRRQHRKQLTVKWNQSLVDPHVTEYCLVMSTKNNYSTLCEAMEEKFGVHPPGTKQMEMIKSKSKGIHQITAWVRETRKEPTIKCIGTQTSLTFSDMERGKNYYFNLFATNRQTNLSYPYGSIKHIFNNIKPITLKNGVPQFVNLRTLDGKAVFKFKVGPKSMKPMKIYIVPCGGSVDVEVLYKKKSVERKRIEGYGKVVIPNPIRGQRYHVRILASNREEFKRMSEVEVLATVGQSLRSLPSMPSVTKVYEFMSLRTCDSVTVGWLPSPDQKAFRYCLVARETRFHEMEGNKLPNHCRLENQLKKDYNTKHCFDIKKPSNDIITQKISPLKPNKSYKVQVTVKKPRGRTLSYDLLLVHTKQSC